MKKRLAFRFFSVLLGLMMMSSVISCGKADPVVIKAIAAWPKTATEYNAFTIVMETIEGLVAKKAPGELKIQFIGGPEAVKSPDQVQAVQRGMVDMVFTTNAYYVSVIKEVDALKLSEFSPSEERANGAWAFLNDIHKKQGLYYVARPGISVPFNLFLKKPIQKANLTGLNIRVSPMYLQLIKGLGGNPVVIPPTEVYAALERNVVDGYCWPAVGTRDWGWQKQTKYVVDPAFYQTPNILLMNLKSWEKLPKKIQDILTEAAAEAEKKVVAFYADLLVKERPLLTKEGIQTITLPQAERDKFLKVAFDEGWKDVLAKNPETGPKLKQLLTKSGK